MKRYIATFVILLAFGLVIGRASKDFAFDLPASAAPPPTLMPLPGTPEPSVAPGTPPPVEVPILSTAESPLAATTASQPNQLKDQWTTWQVDIGPRPEGAPQAYGDILIWTDHGCGTDVQVGEIITIWIEAHRDGYATVYNHKPDGTTSIVDQPNFPVQAGHRYWTQGQMGNLAGVRILRAIISTGAQDYCTLNVGGAGPGDRLCGDVGCRPKVDCGGRSYEKFVECNTGREFLLDVNLPWSNTNQLYTEPLCIAGLFNFNNPVYHYDSSCGRYVLTGYSSGQYLGLVGIDTDCSQCPTTSTVGKIYIWTNRGCGSSFRVGESMEIYLRASQSGHVRIYDDLADGRTQTLSDGVWINADVTYKLGGNWNISGPTGLELLRIVMPSANAQDYCDFLVEGGTSTPTPTLTPNPTPTRTATRSPAATPTPSPTQVTCSPDQWRGEYFNNSSLSGTPALVRCDNTIDFDWGNGSPGPGVNPDNFSVRWTGNPNFAQASSYRFHTLTDDGVRLWVDGNLVIDQWHDMGPTPFMADVTLTAGRHSVLMEYFEHGGGAQAKLWWELIPLCRPGANYAPSDLFGELAGFVKYITGSLDRALSGVTVNISGPVNRTTQTDSQGIYAFDGLPVGSYVLTATLSGYSTYTQSVLVSPACIINNITLCKPEEWRGEYYNNRDLQGIPPLVRCDSNIDFYWGDTSPGSGVPKDNFSARWERTVPEREFPETGWYRFRTFTDDGLRLYVDAERIIDDWTPRSFAEQSALKRLSQGSHQVKMEYVEWARDAMAHLTWYLCANGRDDCAVSMKIDRSATLYNTMDITPTYQTQYPEDAMPDGSVSPNQTIARWGCKITSFAMALQKLNVDTTPWDLNMWLSSHGGYTTERPNCEACLRSDDYITYYALFKKGIFLKWVPVYDYDAAKQVIREKQPGVLMRYPGDHFFLAVDVAKTHGAETFGINDPHHAWACWAVSVGPGRSRLQCSGNSLQHATTDRDRFIGASPIGYLEYTTETHTASLQLNVSGAEVLLTDAQGRRVGYDAVTGQVAYEIPNSFYYDSKIVPPGEQPGGIPERALFLPEDAGGNYTLQIIGVSALASTTASDFVIEAVGFDSQFNLTDATISGAVQPGAVTTFDVTFSPGQEIRATPHCPGDANGDSVVNAVDLSILASEWGRNCSQQPCRADFNQDGVINAVDLSILAANWGKRCS